MSARRTGSRARSVRSCAGCVVRMRVFGRRRRSCGRQRFSSPGRASGRDEIPAGRRGGRAAPCLPAVQRARRLEGPATTRGRNVGARGARARKARLKALIQTALVGSLETYGAPRIQAELADEHDLRVGRQRVARLMGELGIEGISRRARNRYRTTTPAKEAPAAPDLVGRRFTAVAPDRLWVAEIKYVQTREGHLFLAAVIDACTRRCVGRSMRDDLKTELVLGALGMAISKRRAAPGLVHHSDRGSPYTSLAFGKTLQHAGALPGMAEEATPTTTRSPRASSPPSRPSCSSDTPSTPATTPGSRSSTTSKASTTPAEATPRSATSAPTESRKQ